MDNEKAARLLKIIFEKTRDGSLRWAVTTARNAYETNFSSNSVRVEKITDEEENEYYPLYILDENGIEIDDVTASLPNDYWITDNLQEHEVKRQLFNLARSNARGMDSAVDKILKELEGFQEEEDLPF